MRNKKILSLVQGAMIAALYVVLTWLAGAMGLASGVIQIRFSEALTVLPYFTAAAVPGLTVGCLLSNLMTGAALWDIVFGTAATLIGAVFTRLLRKKPKWILPIPPIAANVLVIPFILMYAYGMEKAWLYLVVTVAVGEIISCGVLGMILFEALKKRAGVIFKND